MFCYLSTNLIPIHFSLIYICFKFQVSSFKFIIIIYNNLFAIPIDRTGSLTFVFFLTIFVKASLLRSDHGTRNELAARNNEP